MGIPVQQIGWDQESKLLLQISKQLERLISVTYNISLPNSLINILNQNTSSQLGNLWITGNIKTSTFESTITTGTAPLTITSTTLNTNLNADLLNGHHYGDFVPYMGATGPVNLGAYDLTVNGITTGQGPGTGSGNTVFGFNALASKTNANGNTAFGSYALSSITTGGPNTAFGDYALRSVITGVDNCAFGENVLVNALGSSNCGIGSDTLGSLINGNANVALGEQGAMGIVGNAYGLTQSYNSIFIGYKTRALVNSSVNEVVIGNEAIGHGSNTATWGNTSITDHYFTGILHATEGTVLTGVRGSITLTAGTTTTVTVSQAKTTSTIIISATSVTVNTLNPYVSTKNNGSFVITSTTAAGTETLDYLIVN